MEDLSKFSGISGSTISSDTLNSTMKEFKEADLNELVDEFLEENGSMDRAGIIDKFGASFNKHKHLITHFPGKNMTKEVEQVHPIVFDIVKRLIPAMLKDVGMTSNYCIYYEVPVDFVENERNEFREIPEFSVNLPHLDTHLNVEFVPTFYSMVCPIECKLPGPKGVTHAVVQSVHYLINKIQYQLELRQPAEVNQFGYAFGSTGAHLLLAKVTANNYGINVRAVKSTAEENDESRLCPSSKKELNKTQLEDLPGIVALLAFLTHNQKQLGHADAVGVDEGFVLHEVIGRGSFCSAILAQDAEQKWYCMKRPCLKTDREVAEIQLARENFLLSQFANPKLVNDLYIPHIHRYDKAIPAIFFTEVGLSMRNFLGLYAGERTKREAVAGTIRVAFEGLLKEVHKKHEVTHRDIRPTNIVMYPTKPDPQLHSDFRPILIDWAMAGGIQSLYYPAGLNLDYQPDDIVRLPDKKVGVPYLPKYDLQALQFTIVSIVYNEPIVWWHADKYDRLKVGRDIMVARVISGESLGKKQE
jgi:hypothetical protein